MVRAGARVGGRRSAAPVLALALLAGCSTTVTSAPTPHPPAAAGSTMEPAGPSASPDAPPEPEPPVLTPASGADDVRAAGVPVGVAGLTLAVLTDRLVVEDRAGSRAVVLDAPVTPGPGTVLALLAAPADGSFEVVADGSVVVRDAAGGAVAGLAAPTASVPGTAPRYESRGLDLLAVTVGSRSPATAGPHPAEASVTVWVGQDTIGGLEWGDREGGRSLAVAPTDWMRAGGMAALEVGWAALVAAVPEAGTTTMRDQLACHTVGAPGKETWNLEPWRPEVGTLATMLAGCNPT